MTVRGRSGTMATTSSHPGATGGNLSRRDLIRMAAILGIAWSAVGCGSDDDDEPDGAALGPPTRSRRPIGDRRRCGCRRTRAAHLLVRAGVDVRILEAGSTHGGRMRRTLDFVDFPIPLGAEWLHDDEAVLADIADDAVEVELVGYGPDDDLGFYDGELTIEPSDDDDLKFVGSSWFDFFDEYVVPGVADRLEFDTQVVRIDSTGERVLVTGARGNVAEADAVIVTVPVTILRDRAITFVPDLSDDTWAAVDEVPIWGGIKVFVEFDERFYPTFVAFPDSDSPAGQRLYYDAAHGQDSEAHVLGLFAVGTTRRAVPGPRRRCAARPRARRTRRDLRRRSVAQLPPPHRPGLERRAVRPTGVRRR